MGTICVAQPVVMLLCDSLAPQRNFQRIVVLRAAGAHITCWYMQCEEVYNS